MMKKFAPVLGTVISGLFMVSLVGCGDLNPLENNDEVTITNLNSSVAISGSTTTSTTTNLTGEVAGNVAPVVLTAVLKDAANATVEASKMEVNITQPADDVEDFNIGAAEDVKITILTKTTACNGTYTLTVTATAGDASSTKNVTVTVTGANDCSAPVGTPVTTGDVTVGAHDNASLGSSVDLDDGQVLFSAAAKAANSGVDIVYTYSTTLSKPVIMSPTYAKNSSNIDAFSAWVSPYDTKFHVVSVDFDAVETKEEIEDLFNASLATSGRVEVAAGTVLVVQTSESNYVLIKMNTVSANATGSASIKWGK